MFRYLRYSPAVAFALLALAFVGLWVRSYTLRDIVYNARGHVLSFRGVATFAVYKDSWPPGDPSQLWLSRPINVQDRFSPWDSGLLGFDVTRQEVGSGVAIPYWFLVALSLALAALLAFKPITRFTVRGLLITTTPLAAVLGLAVYAV